MNHENWRRAKVIILSVLLTLILLWRISMAEDMNYSGWRGGIGIAFGSARHIPDATELGYEIIWGDENLACVKILDIVYFRYWNAAVETSIKDSQGRWDFSKIEDKNEAARLAFDAWAEINYGVKGLSKYANAKYVPAGAYGDVEGIMDLSSENPLVTAVIDNYLKWFKDNGINHGGIGIDNAANLPQTFLDILKKRFHAKGLGIASNGCPVQYLSYIDFMGGEGFPYTVEQAQEIRSKGFKGIQGEFTTQHLSPSEMELYLKTMLLNRIVFFGYTDGGIAASAINSFYSSRPDVYNHHRYALRKYIPLSRAIVKAGQQIEPYAWGKSENKPSGGTNIEIPSVKVTADGRVLEWGAKFDIKDMLDRAKCTGITRYGDKIENGIYLYMNFANRENVICNTKELGIDKTVLVFDEFREQVLSSKLTKEYLEFTNPGGPILIQLGTKETIVKNIISRIKEIFKQQLIQRKMDREVGLGYPFKPWAPFCQGWELDGNISRSGKCSMQTIGGIWKQTQWQYYKRRGAAQFVVLNQKEPIPIILSAYSKAQNVSRSDFNGITNRREHFNCREKYIYCLHLYLDYQDGQWPEIHTVSFSAGSHDWEKKTITVTPKKPVKTAMVLLEFQQPSGIAWFDDIFLAQSIEPQKNILAYPGFEKEDFNIDKLNSLSNVYETKINSFLSLLETTQKKTVTETDILTLKREIETLRLWFSDARIGHLWTREVRDQDDVKNKLDLCFKIISTSVP